MYCPFLSELDARLLFTAELYLNMQLVSETRCGNADCDSA
jgi:hypothetical protein